MNSILMSLWHSQHNVLVLMYWYSICSHLQSSCLLPFDRPWLETATRWIPLTQFHQNKPASWSFLFQESWCCLGWVGFCMSVFTSVGSSTNHDTSFALQFLFVFFNSLQGFYVFMFLVILSFDARKAWINILCPYQKLLKFSTRYALKNNGNISSTNQGSTILSNAYSTATLKSSVKQNNQLEIDNDVNSCWDRFCGWVQGLCGKTLSM